MNYFDKKKSWKKIHYLHFFLFLLLSTSLFAQPNSNGSTTNWNSGSGWSSNVVPNLKFWTGANDVIVSHNKNSGSLEITNGNSITIRSGATLTITGSLTMGNMSEVIIDVGGTLVITGSLNATNSPSTFTNNGTLNVRGNYSISGSTVTHYLNGVVTVENDFSATGNTNIHVNGGQIDISGELAINGNAIMEGTSGYITYSSTDIGGCGASFLICHDGTRFGDGNPAWCPHNANPITGGMNFATCSAVASCNTVGGTTNSNAIVCSGTNSGTLTLSGHNGSIIRWEKSTNNWGSTTNISNTSTTQDYNNLVNTTKYRAIVQDATCPQLEASPAEIIVRANLNVGSINTDQTICYNTSPAIFTNSSSPSGGTGTYTYQWQKSTTSSIDGFSNIIGAESSTYNETANLTVGTWYRRNVSSGSCGVDNSNPVKVTISPNTVGGGLNSSNDVCSGSNSGTLTLSGHTGSIVRWESSTDNFSTITEIINSTTTQDYLNMTATTKYRAVVKSGVCSFLNSNNATITVNPLPNINSTTNGYRCGPGSVNLEAIVSDGTVNWYDAISGGSLKGSGSPWLSDLVESTTTFYAEAISSQGCLSTVRIPADAVVLTAPIVELGNDTAICADSTVVFDAIAGIAWAWSNGSSTIETNANTAGDYSVVVTGANGCVGYDTINLVINQLPIVNLGSDTAICVDSIISFDALTGTKWVWNNTNTTRSIEVNTAGDYDVVVTDVNNCVNYDTINLIINQLPILNLGKDTAICVDSTITFDAVTGTNWIWNNSDISRTTTVNNSGDFDVVVTDANGCVNYDTINLVINQLPIVNLGKDTAICVDSTITFDAVTGTSWVWNNSDLTRTTTVNTSGNFDVVVTDANGCVNYDTINLAINQLPIVNLGKDTAICVDSTITFDAVTGINWVWNNDDITRITTVNSSGDFDVVATDANGCVNYDTINLSINQLPVLNLVSDTAICRENIFTLDPSTTPNSSSWNRPMQFTWQDGSNDSTFKTTGQGIYTVILKDKFNCVNYDTVRVDTFPSPIPVINVQDTAICFGDSVNLSIAPLYGFYAWTNSESFTNASTVHSTNQYIVRVFDFNGCIGSDTADVTVNKLPNSEIGDSVKLCKFKDLYLEVPENNAQYLWRSDSTTQTQQIHSSGTYWVSVIDTNNCSSSDTVYIYDGKQIPVNLGNDTTICKGTTLILDASYVHTEIWQSTDSAESYYATEADTFDVLVINSEGCYGRDTIIINVSEIPDVQIIQEDSLPICQLAYEEKILSILNDEGMDIIWNTGETNNEITITETNSYIASKTNIFQCTGKDTIEVYEYCRPVTLTMPNIFTPNGDEVNDIFHPLETPLETLDYLMSHIVEISFAVYNRWGTVIYTSNNVLPHWDGLIQNSGVESSQGTYYWILKYADVSGGNYKENGFVELVR
ncbi:MAG: gliding motility-associated C-terminal domain-containing protein [Flavobacteriales bacterium]|nr:gliding motility-associated C-terminal domain-containing protein [Flavobacteriales bacterium]